MFTREQFKSNIDYIAYKITGKVPKYLEKEEKKDIELVFYRHSKGNGSRGMMVCKDFNRSICSCYEKDYPKISEEFLKEYDGNNFDELSNQYKDKYNLKMYGQNGRRKIEKLEDCRVRFNRRKGSDRIDVRTHVYGREYSLCRCYEHEIPQVRKDFKRMQNNSNFTIEKVRDKLGKKYNLRQNRPRQSRIKSNPHSITITDGGMVYHDGKFIKSDSELYNMVDSLLDL